MMNVQDITQLYYIAPTNNLPGILDRGILSHNRASERKVTDASNPSVQTLRSTKWIRRQPNGNARPLHSYVNLYLQPHNAMMWNLVSLDNQAHRNYCILVISKEILKKPRVLLTNRNAACKSARFMEAMKWRIGPKKKKYLTSEKSGSQNERKEKPHEFEYRKRARQAEALIPNRVKTKYITGFIVSNRETEQVITALLAQKNLSLPITINETYFFYASWRTQTSPIVGFLKLSPLAPYASQADESQLSEEETTSESEAPSHSPTNTPIELEEKDSEEPSEEEQAVE